LDGNIHVPEESVSIRSLVGSDGLPGGRGSLDPPPSLLGHEQAVLGIHQPAGEPLLLVLLPALVEDGAGLDAAALSAEKSIHETKPFFAETC
jgi:hypothetical protein